MFRSYIPYVYLYDFPEKANYRDRKQISGFQGLEMGEALITKGEGFWG